MPKILTNASNDCPLSLGCLILNPTRYIFDSELTLLLGLAYRTDNTAIQRLVLAHEHFFDGRTMFVEFTDFFSAHQSSSAADQIIQARVLNVLKRWIEMSWGRMKQVGLEPLMTKFMDSLSSRLKSILEKAIMQSERLESGTGGNLLRTPPDSKSKKAKPPKKGEGYSLVDFDSFDIAKQLTLIDFELAEQVNLEEMLQAQWVEEPGAPSLFACSKRVNDLTYWLAYQIVSTTVAKKRVKVITQIIKIAKHLLSLNSFNSFMAVYLAFNLASTARLTNTWKQVPARHFQIWKKMSRIMSPMQNFSAYRETIQALQPPMILCQEVLLKDLLYEEEGRPDFVEEGVLDMTKMDAVGRLIDSFRQCRLKPYSTITPHVTIQEFLRDIPSWDSAEEAAMQLDSLSRIVEPSSINFPAGMNSDAASRVKSLGTLPTWRRDSDGSERIQHSNPRPSPRPSPYIDEPLEPLSPRSAVVAAAASTASASGSPSSFTKGTKPTKAPALSTAKMGSSASNLSSSSLSPPSSPTTPHRSPHGVGFAGLPQSNSNPQIITSSPKGKKKVRKDPSASSLLTPADSPLPTSRTDEDSTESSASLSDSDE